MAAILLILGVGVVVAAAKFNSTVTKIEVLDSQTSVSDDKEDKENGEDLIVVDISGEVAKPGVYKLPRDSRIDDVLVASGGILESADSEWISKSLNKASKVSDGQKIFIPARRSEASKLVENQSSVLSASNQVEGASGNLQTANPGSNTININNASQNELESLWGIGPKTAQKIIEQRPYSDISELLGRKIVKSNVYERIKTEISVY